MAKAHFFAIGVAGMLLALSVSAHAQWNNAPYQGRGSDSGVGMSQAYRMAIVEQKMRGIPDGQIHRGRGGELVIVERGLDNQASVRSLEGETVMQPRRQTRRVTGFGYGGRDSARMSPSSEWSGRTGVGGPRTVDAGLAGWAFTGSSASFGVSVVDLWTVQLNAMRR